MVRLLVRVVGIGTETADMLVNEVLSRPMRDRRAVARYAGLTGAPDESGTKRREQGLAKAGNARVRRGMIPLAWRFLRFQKDSALARWYQARTADHRAGTRKTMIVALARKLLIALWRFVKACPGRLKSFAYGLGPSADAHPRAAERICRCLAEKVALGNPETTLDAMSWTTSDLLSPAHVSWGKTFRSASWTEPSSNPGGSDSP